MRSYKQTLTPDNFSSTRYLYGEKYFCAGRFQTRDWSVFSHSTFFQEQYYLTKQRTSLELERNRLDQIKFFLQNKQAELEALFVRKLSVNCNRKYL